MNLKDFVLQNQEIIEFINDRVGGNETIDKYYGTLDYATARFHTILVKISQDKILEAENQSEVLECFNAIQDFYKTSNTRYWYKTNT